MQSSGFRDPYSALMVPYFVFPVAATTLRFAVAFTFFGRVGVFCTFLTSLLVFVALCRPMAVFAAVIALSDLQLWSVFFGGVEAVVDVDSSFYAAVCSVWVIGEYNDRMML